MLIPILYRLCGSFFEDAHHAAATPNRMERPLRASPFTDYLSKPNCAVKA